MNSSFKVRIEAKGNFNKTFSYFKALNSLLNERTLKEYGEMGLKAVKEATPVRTGKTRDSWEYEIVIKDGSATISWYNTNMARDAIPVVFLLIYGHATRSGTFIAGDDFVSRALKPVFDQIVSKYSLEVIEK